MSGDRVVIRSRDGGSGKGQLRCPYCHASILERIERAWSCPACSTAHHEACADEHGRCTVQGCPGLVPPRPDEPWGAWRRRPVEPVDQRRTRVRDRVRAEYAAAVARETRVAGGIGLAVALTTFVLLVLMPPESSLAIWAILSFALVNLAAGGRDVYTGDLEVSWTGSLWSFVAQVLLSLPSD